MRIINTADLTPKSLVNEFERLQVYNGLDCCLTLEVLHAIKPQLDDVSRPAYEFSLSLQAPILEMNMTGVRIDKTRLTMVIAKYQEEIDRLQMNFNKIMLEVFGGVINWRSNNDLGNLFYRVMRVHPIKKRNANGHWVETTDREALERIHATHFYTRPIISHILAMRDLGKKISTLKTSADADGRMRTSYNIGGTTTFRLSSSMSDFGTGGNLQNIEQRLRAPFVADPGMKFAYIDLQQAESRCVGAYLWNIFHDAKYLDACESGDLHTAVSRMAWTNLPWTGDLKADKLLAEQPFYRQHSVRHMAKVLGHGTNYTGKPPQMAVHTKLDIGLIADFQARYFAAFPIARWHTWVADQLRSTSQLFSLTGHRRYFLGRAADETTVREAVAFGPQCSIGVLLNRGMRDLWRANICQIMLQIHDALVIQYPEEKEDLIVPKAIDIITQRVPLSHGREMILPCDAKVGWSWADEEDSNPGGLIKYKPGGDLRRRKDTVLSALELRL